MTWIAYELPITSRSGGSTNVPSVIDLPASTMMPSVQTSAMTTETSGSTTPRIVRNESHNATTTSTSASGVKR